MNWVWILVGLPLIIEAGNPDAKRLYDDLLSNYNKLVRPVVNVSEAVTVRLKLKLSQLIDVVSTCFKTASREAGIADDNFIHCDSYYIDLMYSLEKPEKCTSFDRES